MEFSSKLYRGKLVRRYKRFLADIVLEDGSEVIAHCPNPGAMIGLGDSGSTVWVSRAQNARRKLKYTWELIKVGSNLVGINTNRANSIVEEAFHSNKIVGFGDHISLQREVKYGQNSRVDFLLKLADGCLCYLEVKNVTLKRCHAAEFPDSITSRGARHLMELSKQVDAGNRAVIFFLVQRADCDIFSIARDIDPNYYRSFLSAIRSGVEVLVYKCNLTPRDVHLDTAIPWHLKDKLK